MKKKAFVTYYNSKNIIPTHQDISAPDDFIFKRNYLYTTLGIPLADLSNKRIIEFGPGGGYNAFATCHFNPSVYVFVDLTKVSLHEINEKNLKGMFKAKKIKIIESDILEFNDKEEYDLVVCEAVLCGQEDPAFMLKHISQFVKPNGILIITTSSATSVLSEMLRRVLRIKTKTLNLDFDEEVKKLSCIFKDHLISLGANTRSIENWVLDVISHDYHLEKYTFTMLEASKTLAENFNLYQTSPSFIVDDQWYKKATKERNRTQLLNEQYKYASALFLDYRINLIDLFKIKDSSFMADLEFLSMQALDIHKEMLIENSFDKLVFLNEKLLNISKILPNDFKLTVESIRDFTESIKYFIDDHNDIRFSKFKHWWGRGTQYLSFIKES